MICATASRLNSSLNLLLLIMAFLSQNQLRRRPRTTGLITRKFIADQTATARMSGETATGPVGDRIAGSGNLRKANTSSGAEETNINMALIRWFRFCTVSYAKHFDEIQGPNR